MGAVKQTIMAIADLASEEVEKWIDEDSDDFFYADLLNRNEMVDNSLDNFFESYGSDLADEFEMTADGLRKFVSENRSVIIDEIVAFLS